GLARRNQGEAGAPAAGMRFEHVLDLTHRLDGAFPYTPVPGITFPFRLKPIATLEANGVAANSWEIHEHLGTQIDAPNHFAKGGRSLDQLRVDELIVPVIVIDISERAQHDADTVLTIADITAWEVRHGRVPDGACVMMPSGWQRFVADPARFLGRDAQGVLHFPGISLPAARFLLRAGRLGPRGRHDLDRSRLGSQLSDPSRAARRRQMGPRGGGQC